MPRTNAPREDAAAARSRAHADCNAAPAPAADRRGTGRAAPGCTSPGQTYCAAPPPRGRRSHCLEKPFPSMLLVLSFFARGAPVADAVTGTLEKMPQSSADNPLLSLGFQIPFDRIRAEHVEPAIATLLAGARERLEALAAQPGPRTFDNTMDALDSLTEPLDRAMGVVRHLESVATYPELRAAFNAVQPEVSAFYTGIPLHQGLWHAIKAFAGTAESGALQGPRQRFLHKTMETFRRHGADLDAAGKKRLEEIDVELTQLTTKFSENVLDSTNAFELLITEEADLAGLPLSALESARASAERKGKTGWRFTLQAPDYFALMTYLDNAAIRRRMYEAYAVRATEPERDNRPLLTRILELRRAKADLLGFPNFADLVLEDRMAHNG